MGVSGSGKTTAGKLLALEPGGQLAKLALSKTSKPATE
jgi:gluconate kinase